MLQRLTDRARIFPRQVTGEEDTNQGAPSDLDFAIARRDELDAELDYDQVGLVITMAWNTDNTDVDLHVLEPTGEECYYSHPNTEIGGHITRDVTGGFGPEMYTLQAPESGTYEIKARFYSSDSSRLSARTKVYVTIYQDWGTEDEVISRHVVALETGGDIQPIATIDIGAES